MNRDSTGRLRNPAGAPKSIGGQYAPDNQRGGAVAAGAAGDVATGTVRWQMYDDRGNITHEFGETSFDVHAVLDEMDLSELVEEGADEPYEIAYDEFGDEIMYRAQELGLAPETPMEGLAFAFKVDAEELKSYVARRRQEGKTEGTPASPDTPKPSQHNKPGDMAGMTQDQRIESIRDALSDHLAQHPDDAYLILDIARQAARDSEEHYPAVTIKQGYYSDEEGWVEPEIINPRTGKPDVLCAVDTAVRTTSLDEIGIGEGDNRTISFDYGGLGDGGFHGVMYVTESDNMPVRLPEGWVEL